MAYPLRDRLYRVVGQALSEREGHVRVALPRPDDASIVDGRLEQQLEGRWWETEYGPVFVVEERYPLHVQHGRRPLATAFATPPPVVARFGRLEGGEAVDLRRAAFLDIETTGLVGGAGTLPFLIGIGRYEGNEFVVRQLFLPDPAIEVPLLHALSCQLRDADALVTFNGRAFDVPMLETRFIYHRLRPAVGLPNIDLLYPARRIWRGWLPSCRLTALEEHVLAFQRGDDIPSAEIPSRYFHYLRSGRIDLLRPVLQHNVWDIVSMVALAAEIGRFYSALPDDTPHDLLIAARLWEAEGDLGRAALYYHRALERAEAVSFAEGERVEVMMRLAAVYRRLGQWAKAAGLWQMLIERRGNLTVRPYLELAKYHEHRLRDPATALALVRAGLALVRRYHLRLAPEQGQRLQEELEQRLARLERKLRAAGALVP